MAKAERRRTQQNLKEESRGAQAQEEKEEEKEDRCEEWE